MDDEETCQPRTLPQLSNDCILYHLPQDGLEQFKKQIANKRSEKRTTDMRDTTSETKRKRICIEDDVPSIKTVPTEPMTLSFMRKYKKSFEAMTRSEMEEMVALKIVETFLHKSELAELSAKCDAQELIISSFRTKFYELSKRFHELQMIHCQVIKDMDVKNKNCVTPVKVMRAVGLQVCLPRRDVSADIIGIKAASVYAAYSNANPQCKAVAKKRGSNMTPILKRNTDGAVPQAPRETPQLNQKLQNQQQSLQSQANTAKTLQPEILPITAVIDLTDEDLKHSPSITVYSPPPISGQLKAKFLNNQSRIDVKKIGNQFAPKTENQLQQQHQIVSCTPLQRYHPAPLPFPDNHASCPSWAQIPPPPNISIKSFKSGFVISWTMNDLNEDHAEIMSYQIYAYQETSAVPSTDKWYSVGEVEAMILPMAVTLSKFQEDQRYHFAIRAIDEHARYGSFSIPGTCS